MSNQTSMQLSDETRRQMSQLAAQWGMPSNRSNTPVVTKCVERIAAVEAARRSMSDSEFLGFLATYFAPLAAQE